MSNSENIFDPISHHEEKNIYSWTTSGPREGDDSTQEELSRRIFGATHKFIVCLFLFSWICTLVMLSGPRYVRAEKEETYIVRMHRAKYKSHRRA